MKVGFFCTAVAAATLLMSGAQAQDISAGEEFYKKNCKRCHGPTAKGLASYPGLVGHPVEYLVDRLERYRAGEKIGPNTALMAPQARSLSDDELQDVSHFIFSLQ